MPRIPVFDNRAGLPGVSGLVQQDPEDASILGRQITQSAGSIGDSLQELFGPSTEEAADRTSKPEPEATVPLEPQEQVMLNASYLRRKSREQGESIKETLSRFFDERDLASPTDAAELQAELSASGQVVRADDPDTVGVSPETVEEAGLRAQTTVLDAVALNAARHGHALTTHTLNVIEEEIDELADMARGGNLTMALDSIDVLASDVTGGVDDELLANLQANARREVIEANVLGLAERGDIETAQGALAQFRKELPDGQVAFLERGIARGEIALERAHASERTRQMLLLQARIRAGDDVAWQAEQLAEVGLFSPAERRQIARVSREAEARRVRENALKDRALHAVSGGEPLDPAEHDDRFAAELWWRDGGAASLASFDPALRTGAVVNVVSGLGAVPEDLRRDLVLDLRSGDPDVVLGAARQIMALKDATPGMASEAFAGDELARADIVLTLDRHGTNDLIGDANDHAPVGSRALRPVANRRNDVVTGMAAGGKPRRCG